MVDEIDSSRRAFFRRAAGKAAEKVVEHANVKIEARATRWVRPPFALPELEFILACTRCDECIAACPHDVIFPLPASFGADVAATAVVDVLNGGCHLCDDWPCVAACESGALKRPETEEEVLVWPKMAQANIISEECLPFRGPECGACQGSCPIPETLTFHRERPQINKDNCAGCGLCLAACIAEPKAIKITSKYIQE